MQSARLARLHDAVKKQLGERVRIVPKADGGYITVGDDYSRAVVEVVAYFAAVPGAARTSGNNANSGSNAELRLTSHTLKFVTSDVPYEVVSGDHIVLLERDNQEWRVDSPYPFGTDSTVLRLTMVAE